MLAALAPPLAGRSLIRVAVDVRLPRCRRGRSRADTGDRATPCTASGRFVALPLAVLTLGVAVTTGCEVRRAIGGRRDTAADAPYEAAVEEGLGAAIAVIVDTSGSMKDAAPGDSRPKFEIAKEAIEQMLDATDAFRRSGPTFPSRLVSTASRARRGSCGRSLPYDRAALRAAHRGAAGAGRRHRHRRCDARGAAGALPCRRVPEVPAGGDRRREHRAGATRRGSRARSSRKSEGAVQIYFVAFDTSAEKFGFLKEVGGDVVSAPAPAPSCGRRSTGSTRARSWRKRRTRASASRLRTSRQVRPT